MCYGAYSSHSQEHRGEPLLFSDKRTGSFYMRYTTHGTNNFILPIRRTKQWLSVLLKDTNVTAEDSNPHSADQKHQSLSSVLLTARPRNFHLRINLWNTLCPPTSKGLHLKDKSRTKCLLTEYQMYLTTSETLQTNYLC